jgi:hypothetical protein
VIGTTSVSNELESATSSGAMSTVLASVGGGALFCATELGSDVTVGDDWLHGETDLEGFVVDSVATDSAEIRFVGGCLDDSSSTCECATIWMCEE